MPRDLVVIGASSGGLDPLLKLVGGLPSDLPAAVFVVVHVRPDVPSQLPAILNRSGALPAAHAVDGEPIRRGRIYVAPPAMQMYVHRGKLSVQRGPQENSSRPAIDPMFRTAAHHYGPRVIGVVLSGALDDGSAGLAAVKRGGGIAIVQDPADAAFSDMPANALERADADYSLAAEDIASAIVALLSSDGAPESMPDEVPLETVEEAPVPRDAMRSEQLGETSNVTCPECIGTLWEIHEGDLLRFRCRVGHAFSEEAIVSAQGESVERALWTVLRALEERRALMHKLAERARERGNKGVAGLFEDRGRDIDRDTRAIHELIVSGRTLEPISSLKEHLGKHINS